MKRKMYADELMKKLVSADNLSLLDVVTNDELSIGEKVDLLVKRESSNCSSSK